jgi:site-specific DNA-adenine methylase
LKAAYADPPYLGLAQTFYGRMHSEAAEYDKPETHQRLIDRLCSEYDAWAMSLHSPALRTILPMCPEDVRVMAWVKPFASFKPGVGTAYSWEPVIVRGGRKRERTEQTVRDHVAENITMLKGFPGAKPERFCFWIFDVLNLQAEDEFHDLFPGSGAVSRAWEKYKMKYHKPENYRLEYV